MTDPSEPIPLKSHRRPNDLSTSLVDVGDVRFGDGSYPVIAGPVAVEGEDQIVSVALGVAEAGASMLRASTNRLGNGFRGLGDEGLWLLERAGHAAGIPTLTEVVDSKDLDVAAGHVDMLEIGPDNMQHFSLLRDVGKVGKPVMLHRGAAATIDEWLMAAEYVLSEGNDAVVLCERGSRGFDPRTSDTLDIGAIPVVQRLSHLPVVVDPAPVRDGADLIAPLALAGRSVGADGLVVLVHPDPERAEAGNGSQLDLTAFGTLMDRLGIPSLRDEIDRIDRELVRLVARRLHSSIEIARIKATKGLPLRSPDRESELVAEVAADAERMGVDPDFASELMTLVLDHSRHAQRAAVEGDPAGPIQ